MQKTRVTGSVFLMTHEGWFLGQFFPRNRRAEYKNFRSCKEITYFPPCVKKTPSHLRNVQVPVLLVKYFPQDGVPSPKLKVYGVFSKLWERTERIPANVTPKFLSLMSLMAAYLIIFLKNDPVLSSLACWRSIFVLGFLPLLPQTHHLTMETTKLELL